MNLFGGDPEGDVRDEIEHYLDLRTREFMEQGMDEEEARAAARRAFGDVERIEAETVRLARRRTILERWRTTMGGWAQDLRFSVRTVVRNPLFSAAIVATLALGIGATTAVFSVVDATLLRPLPFEDTDRLVFLRGYADTPEGVRFRGGSYPEILDWEEGASSSFTDVAVVDGVTVSLTGEGDAERVGGEIVSGGFFELLGVEPLRGRVFDAAEARAPDDAPVVVIGHDLWERRFGRSDDALGATLRVNDVPLTVVGVMPETFQGLNFASELWIPETQMWALGVAGGDPDDRGSRWLGAVGRLAPGVELEAAQGELDRVAASLAEAHPNFNRDRGVMAQPVRDVMLGSSETLVLVLLGAVGLVLLIACANVTNLLLVRATGRGREVLMRLALGAGRKRLVRQFVTESLLLAALGTGAGLLVAVWGIRALESTIPAGLFPGFVEVTMDPRIFAFAVGLLLVTGVVSGLAPALNASRLDISAGLKEGARGAVEGGTGRRGFGLRSLLVVGEVALALVLLVGAGLMLQSFRNQLAVDPGFDADRVVGFSVQLPEAAYPDSTVVPFARQLVREVEGLPGVQDASLATDLPLGGSASAFYTYLPDRPDEEIRTYRHRVQPGFYETMGIQVLRGRAFRPDESEPGVDVVMISEAYAERFFADRNPVGESILLGSMPFRIVGVVESVRYRDLTSNIVGGEDDPDVYYPWGRSPSRFLDVAVRTGADPASLLPAIRNVVARQDPSLPVYNAAPLSQNLRQQTGQARFGSFLLGTFSVLALLLAAVGIYGVMAVSVGRRTREIALRMAMGADAGGVTRIVVGQGMRLVGGGLVIGLLGALVLSRTLSTFLFGVEQIDPPTYAAVALSLAAVGLAASWIPARRATRIEPQQALTVE